MEQIHSLIAKELAIKTGQVAATAALLEEGATVPFIARYRKEATGLLDEVGITAIRDRLTELAELEKRRKTIINSLTERDLLSAELERAVKTASSLTALEDVYLPHRPKRRTRAQIAREAGLEPLADKLYDQGTEEIKPVDYLNEEVENEEAALAGARDILAERISEDGEIRSGLRDIFTERAVIKSTVVKKHQDLGVKFKDYFDWQEATRRVPGHRFFAMLRGEKEKVLSVIVRPPEEDGLGFLYKRCVRNKGFSGRQMALAVEDSYKRLLAPSLENELRAELKAKADQEAITVFGENLRELLLAPPLGQKRVMALDPGFRTGAKLVCLGELGALLHSETIYPVTGEKLAREAGKKVVALCREYAIQAIAIGNGTAGRETEAFVRRLDLPGEVLITMVDESGASVYSASETARREFPDQDITVRGAVSIGRRLQDPLAELVKLDPKVIGVGQYQHDVNQKALKQGLEDVVMSCVNSVGVEVNSASPELLAFVSGLGPTLAANIVARRESQGPFKSRQQLLKVPRLGRKAFEQCAGFLRINGAANPLDSSAVHPECYPLVEQMAADLGCDVDHLIGSGKLRQQIKLEAYVSSAIGLPTMVDIMAELDRPGRDPRAPFTGFAFAEEVQTLEDLVPGMRLPGIVTNVTKFGAFVDIGVHQDGLVHISQLADRFVRDPAEIVKVRQQVHVRVLDVDIARKRISLSLREEQ